KGLRIPKELRHPDQEIAIEVVQLGSILTQELNVVSQSLKATQGHAPFEAAFDGRAFVVGEIDANGAPQQAYDLVQSVFGSNQAMFSFRLLRIRVPAEAQQFLGDALGWQDVIDVAVVGSGTRHARLSRGLLVLGEGDAALGLDRLETEHAVG